MNDQIPLIIPQNIPLVKCFRQQNPLSRAALTGQISLGPPPFPALGQNIDTVGALALVHSFASY